MSTTTEDASRAASLPGPARVRRSGAHRIVDLTVFLAIAAGLVLTIVRFLGWLAPHETDLPDAPQETAVQEATLSLRGWNVTHQIHEANPTSAERVARLRELAAAAAGVALPLAPDAVESGFRKAELAWSHRERIGATEIRDTGDVPGTGAVVLFDPRDPAGERIIAWHVEIPLPGGKTQTIETVRSGLAPAAAPLQTDAKFSQRESAR